MMFEGDSRSLLVIRAIQSLQYAQYWPIDNVICDINKYLLPVFSVLEFLPSWILILWPMIS